MSAVHIVVGVLIVWLIASPTAAVVLGRLIRGRNRQVPTTPESVPSPWRPS